MKSGKRRCNMHLFFLKVQHLGLKKLCCVVTIVCKSVIGALQQRFDFHSVDKHHNAKGSRARSLHNTLASLHRVR